ncbi:MAG: hypothetical protein ACRD19_13745 [Terriglobia bacterium]
MKNLLHGIYGAVPVPRRPNGELDEAPFRAWLSFLSKGDIRGFAVNGTAGEFGRATGYEFDHLGSERQP